MGGTIHGYSGKPLFEKIGVRPGMNLLAVSPPPHYGELMLGAEEADLTQVGDLCDARGRFDIVHLFCARKRQLEPAVIPALAAVNDHGMLWVSWPKKSSGLFIDLTENDVRAALLPHGWVDVKVCAVDPDWSGLKFLERRRG